MTNECKKEIMKKIDTERITEETEIRCSVFYDGSKKQCVYIDYTQGINTEQKESDMLFTAPYDHTVPDSIMFSEAIAIGEYLGREFGLPLITEYIHGVLKIKHECHSEERVLALRTVRFFHKKDKELTTR